jgi:hypothetical protein
VTALGRALGWFVAPSDRPPELPSDGIVREDGSASDAGTTPRSVGASDEIARAAVITSAAVLGRPGEAEPVAAALALALRRDCRAKAGAVVVVGSLPDELCDRAGGGGAARRVVDRLDAHGLHACVRGRLAWLRLDPGDPRFAAAARRATLLAAPAVLAITAPRTVAIDEALAEQDLLVMVTGHPDGPLARLAAAGLPGVPLAITHPFGRGLAPALARAGLRPPRSIRALVRSPSR